MTDVFASAETIQNGLFVISGATLVGGIGAIVKISILWGQLSSEVERLKLDINAAHKMRRCDEERLRALENTIARMQHKDG